VGTSRQRGSYSRWQEEIESLGKFSGIEILLVPSPPPPSKKNNEDQSASYFNRRKGVEKQQNRRVINNSKKRLGLSFGGGGGEGKKMTIYQLVRQRKKMKLKDPYIYWGDVLMNFYERGGNHGLKTDIIRGAVHRPRTKKIKEKRMAAYDQ